MRDRLVDPEALIGLNAIPELRALETLGTCRRGYFVEGLGGAQFALPGAVERLRERPPDEPKLLVLAAADPAQPYGAALPWPRRAGARAARVAGASVVLRDGEAVLFVERGGRSLVPLCEPDPEWLGAAFGALVAIASRASTIGWIFITMPCPPPYGVSSVVRCRSWV